MTISETKRLMAEIADIFPSFANCADPKRRAETWATVLEKYPAELCAYAARQCFERNKFAPSLAEIIDIIKSAMSGGRDNAVAAWNALRRAISRASVVTQEEFDALPPEARRFCGGLSGLRNYGMMETAQLDTVTQSNFFKRYDSLKRDRELQEDMPPEIRGLVQQALQNKALPALPPAGGNPPALPEKPQPPAERKALGPPKPPPAPPPDAPKRAPYEPPDADEWERLREIQLEKLRAAGIKA